MTNPWTTLVSAALLGTDRMANLPELPPALAPLMPKIDANEHRLLTQIALLATWLRAGAGPTPGRTIGHPCADDSLTPAELPPALLQLDNRRMLAEWCELAFASGRCVPPYMLPEFLDRLAEEQDPIPAEGMRRVLGTRGAWLATYRPAAWGRALPETGLEPATAWQAGTRAERIGLLQRLRRHEPDTARDLIASTLEDDAPDDVAHHIAQLGVGLTMRDHDFLEARLDAKHKPIRAAAAALLARLPDSARSRRMIGALAPRLRVQTLRTGLLRTTTTTIEIDLPEKLPTDEARALARDGVETAKKRGRLGPKANLLLQLVAGAPLDWYGRQSNLDPEEIVAIAIQGDWAEALIVGWTEACIAQSDAPWSAALLKALTNPRRTVGELLDHGTLARLLRLQSISWREGFLRDLIAARPEAIHDADVLALLVAADHAWSEAFSAFVLSTARKRYLVQTPWNLRRTLPQFAPSIDPSCAPSPRDGWPIEAEQWSQADSAAVDQLAAGIELRCRYLKELRP